MAKAPNEAQLEFIRNNCETHDKDALASSTGLDPETCEKLRCESLVVAGRNAAKKLGQVGNNVIAMTPDLLARVGGGHGEIKEMGNPTDEQRRQLAERRAQFVVKARPD